MIFPLAFIEGIGGPELMMILFIILLLFGANRLPDLARGLGRSVKEFRRAASGVEEEIRSAMEEKPGPIEDTRRFPSKPVYGPPSDPASPAAGNLSQPEEPKA